MSFKLQRYNKNPILVPREGKWDSMQVCNLAACYDGKKVYLVYSARITILNLPLLVVSIVNIRLILTFFKVP